MPSKIVGRQTVYGPIPRRLTPIFRDRDELATASDLSTEIRAALESSLFLLVMCSPAAAKSKWVNEEIRIFKHLHGEERVRAVIVDGVPFSGDPATECFPEALRFHVDKNGDITEDQAEPLAADLRKEGDGKKYAISKLVAGLIGARLDDLIQREQARRNARLRVVAGGFGVVSLAFATIAWEAMRQRDTARAAEAKAIEARNDAEDLIEFMLTDLRTRLDAVGRLDVLDTTGQRALKYYEARDLETTSPDALGRRARAQLLVGEVDNMRGDLEAALAAYEAAAKTTEEQLRRDPDEPGRIFDHSQSVFWVGYIAWQRGDAETARNYFTQYHEQAKRLVEIEPDNNNYQAELGYAYSNLGILAMDEGNAPEAEDWFRKSFAVSSALSAKQPDDIDLLIAAENMRAWLADALYRQLAIKEATLERSKEIEIYEKVISENDEHSHLIERLIVAHEVSANLDLATNNLDNAYEHAITAVRHAERMYGEEPADSKWLELVALSNATTGEILMHQSRFEEAKAQVEYALVAGQTLVDTDDSVALWQGKYLAWPRVLLARIEMDTQNKDNAEALINSAIESLGGLVEKKQANIIILRRYCNALLLRHHMGLDADQPWPEILGHLTPHTRDGDPRLLTILAHAHLHNGDLPAAVSLSNRLAASNYQHPEFLKFLEQYPELRNELSMSNE